MTVNKSLSEKEKTKLLKILKKTFFFSFSTSVNDEPQSTMVQPILLDKFKLQFISGRKSKKVKNVIKNPKSWMICDSTGMFKIPKSVYLKGISEVEDINEENFLEHISHHGKFSQNMYKRMVKDTMKDSVLITFIPSRIITIGHFGGMGEQVAFDL